VLLLIIGTLHKVVLDCFHYQSSSEVIGWLKKEGKDISPKIPQTLVKKKIHHYRRSYILCVKI